MDTTRALRLWPEPAAPATARDYVRTACALLPRPVIDDACLLVSELVTNGVRHARTMLTVAVDCDGDRVSVAVHDDSAAAVAPRPDLSPADESGRGLALVEAVARAWGVVTGDTGKTVWFRLP